MNPALLLTLAALLCVLPAQANVTPMKDFDLTQMNGRWYLVGFSTNAQWFVEDKVGMNIGLMVMVPTEGGDLDLSYSILNADGNCWRTNHLANKTETPGRFTYHGHVWNNENDMMFVDVQYAEYALVHNVKTSGATADVLLELYSRTPEVSAVVQEKFRQLSQDSGILPDNIVMLPKNGKCRLEGVSESWPTSTAPAVEPEQERVVPDCVNRNSAIIGGIIAVVIFAILVFLIRYMFGHKGTYHTHEANKGGGGWGGGSSSVGGAEAGVGGDSAESPPIIATDHHRHRQPGEHRRGQEVVVHLDAV